MDYGETEGNFDVIIVNDDLQSAYKALRSFMLSDIRRLIPDRPLPLVLCGPSGDHKVHCVFDILNLNLIWSVFRGVMDMGVFV